LGVILQNTNFFIDTKAAMGLGFGSLLKKYKKYGGKFL